MVFFIVLVIAYGLLVRRPLDAVLAERRKRTSGAVEQARSAMSAAEAETAVFEDKLRAARAEIYAARDQRLAKWAAERESMLAEARPLHGSEDQVGQKLELERGTAEARDADRGDERRAEREDSAGGVAGRCGWNGGRAVKGFGLTKKIGLVVVWGWRWLLRCNVVRAQEQASCRRRRLAVQRTSCPGRWRRIQAKSPRWSWTRVRSTSTPRWSP